MEKKWIYLDDVRTPVDPKWVVVRTYEEFVYKVTEIGLENIQQISFDHDLGPSAMTEWHRNVYSNYQLNYGTVDAVGNSGANFSYSVANSPPVQGGVNCQAGLLDGQVPSTAAQAQLLNAACQVAYGPDPKSQPLPRLWSPSAAVREWLILLLGAGIGFGGYALAKRGQPNRSV